MGMQAKSIHDMQLCRHLRWDLAISVNMSPCPAQQLGAALVNVTCHLLKYVGVCLEGLFHCHQRHLQSNGVQTYGISHLAFEGSSWRYGNGLTRARLKPTTGMP